MASSVIHMCVAKRINKKLNIKDENLLLLGSIAPDISKHLGDTKVKSHFLTEDNVVDVDSFLTKYRYKLNDPFILGYFIHLYTDFLWSKYFISEIVNKNSIKLLNGEVVKKDPEIYKRLIYNDYTNLNIELIDAYGLDLSLFYEEAIIPNVEMDEIPVNQLSKLLEHTGIIIANTKVNKAYTFDLDNIKPFIETSSMLILSVINQMNKQ